MKAGKIMIYDINNNIISNRWKIKYDKQPQYIKDKLDLLDSSSNIECQLQVIKRKRNYPQVGDIFILKPNESIKLNGVVVKNNINNINGDNLLLVLIFKPNIDVKKAITKGIENNDLLISPVMVGKEYWTRGFFFNVDCCEDIINTKNYGFYSVGKQIFIDEYGNELLTEPQLLGTYGVATIYGIAREVNQELIILGAI